MPFDAGVHVYARVLLGDMEIDGESTSVQDYAIGIRFAVPLWRPADFMLSPEGQELLNAMGRPPVSTKVRTHMNKFEYTLIDPAIVLDEQDRWVKEWDKLFLQK